MSKDIYQDAMQRIQAIGKEISATYQKQSDLRSEQTSLYKHIPQLFAIKSYGKVDYLPEGYLFVADNWRDCRHHLLDIFRHHLEPILDAITLDLILDTILSEDYADHIVEINQYNPFDEGWDEIEALYEQKQAAAIDTEEG